MGDTASDSTPLAMWIDGDGDCGWQCVAEKKDRIEAGGEAGYALMLRVLGRNRRLGPRSGDLHDNPWWPCLPAIFFNIAVRGDTQREGLVGGLARPMMPRDDADGVRHTSRFGGPERTLSMRPMDA